ncbi:CaiB/BaiF CoA-transferase family protein [Mycobacterium sp. AT1]|uniref:CaiB/BaiF CoA transferase family protein n=1 Tax=Mycobacterium sp. AT1 TaxID=1961706 RepID=UPI0009ADE171|nr:CoA transferase [Mycobacterium sp. AT1]OPX11915.1 CoA transferase [Mycobacterium sp. AT1]
MKPLAGITVVDFSRVLAAPSATQVLAELGARIIKVERPRTGDETRQFEPRYPSGESGYFFAFNRGKESITLDLKTEDGQQIARDLVTGADVVIENFLPGVINGLGLGYDRLSADRADLVYVSTTGFGQTGPDRREKGYDTIFQALSGIMAMTGHPDGPPAKAGIPVSDLTSGLWVVIAVLTGLMGKALHGTGCYVDVSMMDVQLSLHALTAARIFALDEEPQRTGTEHPGRVPSAAFKAADGHYLHISCSDQHWAPLCASLALPELGSDPALSSNAGRIRQRDRIMTELAVAIATRNADDVVATLKDVGVPAGRVRSVREALEDPHAQARHMVQSFKHPTEGDVRALRNPLRLNGWDDPDVLPAPLLGADTEHILATELGLTADRIAELRRQKVV